MAQLFSPFTLRGLTIRNRIVMAPMVMNSAVSDGRPTDWHTAHYLARAIGGCGLLLTEATAVEPRGRISQRDLGLWEDGQVEPLARLVQLVQTEGAAIGVQLAHAGRKAWSADRGFGPEPPVGPSALSFDRGWKEPCALTQPEIAESISAWQAAARRALATGFDVVEIHAAHGYQIHQFLSPISNRRTDEYGGSLENRMRFLMQVTEAIREIWPPNKPLFVRVSATDWAEQLQVPEKGLTPDEVVVVAKELRERGVDLIDCSSGGSLPASPQGIGAGYQVPFAEQIRREAGIATAAVGLITTPEFADEIIRNARADLVILGRELLRRPYWPLNAAQVLGQEVTWPRQYQSARPPQTD
jgi:2,4-dienoyl-CoA reductase-like NADH-dependent reductase (Old Yellow Enzyme family)